MNYAIIKSKDGSVLILDNRETDYTDFVDCDTKSITMKPYLSEV